MKIRTYLLLAVVLAFFAGFGYWQRTRDAGRGEMGGFSQARFLSAFMTPIAFYGRVVDQHGEPVAAADVYFSANDLPWGDGSKYAAKTDADGRFEITGARGGGLYVRVSKVGYDTWYAENGKQASRGGFDYALVSGDSHKPDKASPVVFKLRKPSAIEPLEMRARFRVTLPRDGGWRLVPLHEDKDPAHGVNLRCVSKLDTVPFGEPYDWEFEISVPKGGLVERTGKNLFVAPEGGYRPGDKIVMRSTLEPWNEGFEKEYFVRFDDGIHARLKVRAHARSIQLAVCESWMNLKAGSRQLEVIPLRLDP